MKIVHIVGNRPQFIKLAPVSREIRSRGIQDIIIHSGQHFDQNMSEVFFEEMSIPQPDINLHISGGSHAQMTANMMLSLEPELDKLSPDIIMVYGDTNTTLAAALTAKKMGIPVAHVEAGIRTEKEYNPEEINRQVVDKISNLLFAANMASYQMLCKENMGDRAFFTGDVMYDAFIYYREEAKTKQLPFELPDDYVLMTWHRAENTSDQERMEYLLSVVSHIPEMVVCPMHPRTKNKLMEYGLWEKACNIKHLLIIPPVGYIEMVKMLCNSQWVLTDSGGLSKESFFAGKRCMTMINATVWPELVESGWIIPIKEGMSDKEVDLEEMLKKPHMTNGAFGEGDAAKKIVDIILKQGK